MALFTTYLAALRKVQYCSAYVFPNSGKCVKILYVMRKCGSRDVYGDGHCHMCGSTVPKKEVKT